jgi:Protein of unknown function (DUF1573)
MRTDKNTVLFSLFFLLFLGLGSALSAQTPADIRPLLNALSETQQSQVLDYMHSLGAENGVAAQTAYEQLNAEKRGKTAAYIRTLQGKTDTGNFAEIAWNRDTLYFGEIEEGSFLLDSFVVTNVGTRPYAIRDVRTSCDCTVIRFPVKPLQPGQSAAIRIEFDSTGKAGHARPGIIVYDNSYPNARSILYLDGDIVPKRKVKVIRN